MFFIEYSISFLNILVGLDCQYTVHDFVTIEVLNSTLSRLGLVVLDNSSCQSSPEVILLDMAFFHGSFSGKEFLCLKNIYIEVIVGELWTQTHDSNCAEKLFLRLSCFLLLLKSLLRPFPDLLLNISLTPVSPAVIVLFVKAFFDKSMLVRLITSGLPILLIFIIGIPGAISEFFRLEFLNEDMLTCLRRLTLSFSLSFLMRSSRETSAML